MVNGARLRPDVQTQVLSSYPYRMTHESMRRWPEATATMLASGFRCKILSDREWLAATDFAVTKSGNLDSRVKHCYSRRAVEG